MSMVMTGTLSVGGGCEHPSPLFPACTRHDRSRLQLQAFPPHTSMPIMLTCHVLLEFALKKLYLGAYACRCTAEVSHHARVFHTIQA